MNNIFKIRCHHLILRFLQQANSVVHLMCDRKVQLNYEGKEFRKDIKVLSVENRQLTAYNCICAFKS
jgi:hypothetical protein